MEKRTLTFLILFFAVLVGSLHFKYKKPPEAQSINEMAQNMMQPRNWQGKFAPTVQPYTLPSMQRQNACLARISTGMLVPIALFSPLGIASGILGPVNCASGASIFLTVAQ